MTTGRFQTIRLSVPSAAILLLVAGACLGGVESERLEGFEKFTNSTKAASGKFTVQEAGQGVTEGQQALKLQPRASVTIPIKTPNIAKLPWLKIDTFVDGKTASTRLRFYFDSKRSSGTVTGFCNAGQDTLALPLSVIAARTSRDWPWEGLKLTLSNVGAAAVTVDNVRLEAAEPAPPGAVLVDFGPERQALWPGFSPSSPAVAWSGKNSTRGGGYGFPDPLTGDYLAPDLYKNWEDHVTLDSKGPGVAWMWVSHYGQYYIQAPEFYVKAQGKILLGRRLTLKQLLGPEGMQEGIDGDWTPQWMEKTYAGHFTELVQMTLQPGKNQIDMCNAQVAAVAIAPTSSHQAMKDYVDRLKKDLAQYRRQFVLGQRVDCSCKVEPTEDEVKSGVMLFAVPRGSSIDATFVPKEDARVKTLRAMVYNGGTAIVSLAAVPLKKAILSGSAGPLHSSDGKGTGQADLWFVQRVAQLSDTQATMVPRILCRRLTAAERDVVDMAVMVSAPPAAPAGDYACTVRINVGASHVNVPLEVKILRCGTEGTDRPPTFGVNRSYIGTMLYGTIPDSMDHAQQDKLGAKLRSELLALGLNSFCLQGCEIYTPGSEPKVYDNPCLQALRACPCKAVRGTPVMEISSAMSRLKDSGNAPGGVAYGRLIGDVISHTSSLAAKAGLPNPVYHTVTISKVDDLERSVAANQAVSAHARVAMNLYDEAMMEASTDELLKALKPVSVLMLSVNDITKYMDKVDAWRKADEDRELYLVLRLPEEYGMGFYAWGQGAKGWFLTDPFCTRPYRGFDPSPNGVLASDSDIAQPCIQLQSVLWMRQGMSDFILARRAETLVRQAKKTQVDCSALAQILDDIRTSAREPLRYIGPRTDKLDKQRNDLMQAAADLCAKLKGK